MRTITKLGALFVFVTALACAETWTGKLVDANCDTQKKTVDCAATTATTAFALMTSDKKVYKFDSEGNKKAAEALSASESGAERLVEPDADTSVGSHDVTATVSGTMTKGHIEVESIEVQ